MAQGKIKLSVDTGSILIEIDDKGEPIGSFKFNPNDLDIVKRYEKVVESFESMSVPENADINDIFNVSDEIKKSFDYLLNYNVSEEIFKKCNPLTITQSGDFYCENVLAGIANLIECQTEQRIAKKKAKINKATAKYKGK